MRKTQFLVCLMAAGISLGIAGNAHAFSICIDPGHGFEDGGSGDAETSFFPEGVVEKDITIGPDGLLLEFAHPRMSNRLIGWNQVTRIVLNDGDVLLMLAVRRYTFLLIPSSSISDPGVLVALRQHFSNSLE